jgi:hypothetical protein
MSMVQAALRDGAMQSERVRRGGVGKEMRP